MYNSHTDGHSNKKELSSSRWNRIIILDKDKNPIQDQIYYLDNKARLLTKLKRQKRRDLGKVTGKKKVPKNWKQIIENLDDPNFSSIKMLNNSIDIPSEPLSSSLSSSDQESQQYDALSLNRLISIDWLLNQPTEIPQVV